MDNKKRDKLTMIHDLLLSIEKEKKYHRQTAANLPSREYEKHLKNILHFGLIEGNGNGVYVKTEKGKKFIEIYREICDLIPTLLKEDVKHCTSFF